MHLQANKAAQQYGSVALHAGIEAATPHRLVQMLMDGALEKIVVAKTRMLQGQIAEKGEMISWAISIIEGLRASLDKEAGGEISRNLNDLYEYMNDRLLLANIRNDPAMLDEVATLLRQIKSGWDAIPSLLAQGR